MYAFIDFGFQLHRSTHIKKITDTGRGTLDPLDSLRDMHETLPEITINKPQNDFEIRFKDRVEVNIDCCHSDSEMYVHMLFEVKSQK